MGPGFELTRESMLAPGWLIVLAFVLASGATIWLRSTAASWYRGKWYFSVVEKMRRKYEKKEPSRETKLFVWEKLRGKTPTWVRIYESQRAETPGGVLFVSYLIVGFVLIPVMHHVVIPTIAAVANIAPSEANVQKMKDWAARTYGQEIRQEDAEKMTNYVIWQENLTLLPSEWRDYLLDEVDTTSSDTTHREGKPTTPVYITQTASGPWILVHSNGEELERRGLIGWDSIPAKITIDPAWKWPHCQEKPYAEGFESVCEDAWAKRQEELQRLNERLLAPPPSPTQLREPLRGRTHESN